MKSLNIRKGALLSAVAAMVITTVFAVPAKAAADDLITPNNGTCEFAAASLGHGSQSDPFLIGTSKQLAEISDCSKRQATITGAVGNGTSVTFTAENSFGVGQAIEIAAVSPGGFNRASARVTAATSTSFTIASTVTDTYSDSGVATDNSTFYSLTADIDLSTGNDAWNNVDSAVITNATGDGSTITYTAANTFEAGQEIVVKNVNPIEYSVGAVTVVSATATEFTVSGSASSAYVSGGEANSLGWQPISNGRNFTFIGNGHTISGLTSHRPQNRLALFDQVTAATFLDFNMTDVEVDVTGPSNYNYTAGLTGSSTSSIYRNLNIAGTVIGSTNHIGLVSGEARGSIMSDIEVSGMILSGRTTSFSSGQNAPQRMGGLAGYQYGTIEDSRSSVNVYGYMTNNVEDARSYGRNIGSLVGTQDGNIVNSYATGEVHGGNQTGGLTGYQCCGDVANSYATGNVFGYANVNTNVDYIGGFIGDYGCCGAIRDSYSTGDVTVVNSGTTGAGYIGGFLGSNDCCSLVLNSYSTGDVNVTASLTNAAYQVGGFIGHHDCCNNIVGSHSTGDVTVNNGHQIGGFIGLMEAETAIYDSYSTGDVTVSYDGEAEVGGFIGEVLDDINLIRSYATGNVTVTPITDGQSTKFVGGLIGVTDNGPVQIVDSYYVGSVTASDFVGGLIGWNNAGAVVVKNTYVSAAVTATDTNANVDAIANGFLTSFDGSNVYNSTVSVTALNSANFVGKTTAELQNKATFTGLGWNFDADNGVWTIASDVNGGLPTLVAPKAANNGGGTTPEIVEKSVSLSSKNGVLSLSAATRFKVRTYTVNLPNTFAKKQVKVNVVRAGKVVKVLKVAKLNKGGNITFNSKFTLKKGDLVQVRDAKKVRATVTIS